MAPAQVHSTAAGGGDEKRRPEIAVRTEPGQPNGSPSASGVAIEGRRGASEEVVINPSAGGGGASEPPIARVEDDPDATEHSSSFGDSFSSGYSGCEKSDEIEVDSGVCIEGLERAFPCGLKRVSRKKKLTDHWRSYIRPVMWRCQWLELRMNELHSRALKYDKELAKYVHENHLRPTRVEIDGSPMSSPLVYTNKNKQVMKRRKRKRNEDTVNISEYMSLHNIFSYFENRKSEANNHSVNDDICDPDERIRGIEDVEGMNEWLKLGDSESSSLEQILLSADDIQSRVLKLKERLNVIKQAWDVPSSPGVPGPADPPACFGPLSPSYSHGDAFLLGSLNASPQHASGYETEDAILPGSTVSSFGDAAETSVIESALDLLTAPHLDAVQSGEFCRAEMEEVLISNQAAEEELEDVGNDCHVAAPPPVAVKQESGSEGEEDDSKLTMLEPGTAEDVAQDPQPPPAMKPCYTGKRRGRKPKRKRRGGFSGRGGGGGSNERPQKRRSVYN